MHKNRYYKAPKPLVKSQKQKQKEKPEWTTDFTDYNKYKLSEKQMIQRKAALQSKNRQTAKEFLEQRRKKLQMGIIDQDTRKVYETALQSKNIDLNPQIRRNLSQMIQYERERKETGKTNNEQDVAEQDYEQDLDNEDIDGQIEEAKKFIKKLEKAKKQGNIQRAIDIMLDDQPKQTFLDKRSNQKIKNKRIEQQTEEVNEIGPEETLTNIQSTIKFMQEKLFNPQANKNKSKPKQQPISMKRHQNNFIASPDTNPISIHEPSFDLEGEAQDDSLNQFMKVDRKIKNSNFVNNKQKLNHKENMSLSIEQDLSQLKIQFGNNLCSNQNEDEDCMATIRRMRQMIQSKQHLYEPQIKSHKENYYQSANFNEQKPLKAHNSKFVSQHQDEDVEVDFSLTMNQEQQRQLLKQVKKNQFSKISKTNQHKSSTLLQYQNIKRNLFDEVDRLNQYCHSTKNQSKVVGNKSNTIDLDTFNESDNFHHQLQQSQYHEQQRQQRKKKSNGQKKKKNQSSGLQNQLFELRTMVDGNRDKVKKIEIMSRGSEKSGVMGFDFRGSINLKKSVVN